MSKLVFRLKDVPLEEAEAVRTLLQDSHIEFYETDAGNWGVSLAGIWVRDEEQAITARQLIDSYQHSHHITMSKEHLPKLIDTIRRQPVKFILSFLLIAVILYFSLKPFLLFGN